MITKRKFYISILITFIAAVLVGGYINSDAVFYRRVIRLNGMEKPGDVFTFFKKSTLNAFEDSLPPLIPSLPPRDVIEAQRGFWCDEGSIAMGKFLDYMKPAYEYRLVDVFGPEHISNHTVLQVLEDKKWKTYDVFFKTDSLPPELTMHGIPATGVKYRTWNTSEKIYHYIIEHNSVVKYIVLKMRGVY